MDICLNKLCHHCSRYWIAPVCHQTITWANADFLSIEFLEKIQWRIDGYWNNFIQENAFENVTCKISAILFWPQYVTPRMICVDTTAFGHLSHSLLLESELCCNIDLLHSYFYLPTALAFKSVLYYTESTQPFGTYHNILQKVCRILQSNKQILWNYWNKGIHILISP